MISLSHERTNKKMKRRRVADQSLSLSKKVHLVTLQGICLISLAANLPITDIAAVQKAFKTEIVLREKNRVTKIVCDAMPTWSSIEGFEVLVHSGAVHGIAVAGTFKGMKLSGTSGRDGYGSFIICNGYVKFIADAMRAIVNLVGRSMTSQFHISNNSLQVHLREALKQLVPKADYMVMIEELVSFVKERRKLLKK